MNTEEFPVFSSLGAGSSTFSRLCGQASSCAPRGLAQTVSQLDSYSLEKKGDFCSRVLWTASVTGKCPH